MRIGLLFLLYLFINLDLIAQKRDPFSKAVEKERFNKVSRIFKHQVKGINRFENKKNDQKDNFYFQNIDSLTNWLKSKPSVLDVMNDKCQNKILIYPGHSSVGAKFKTKNGIFEKCFLIQQGTTGDVKIFKWRFHLFKYKDKLVYKKIYDCEGFIDRENENCNLAKQQNIISKKADSSFINANLLLGEWESMDTIRECVVFTFNELYKEYNLKTAENSNYVFFINSNHSIYYSGTTIAWPPMGCKISPISADLIEIEYSDYSSEIISRTKYQRVLKVGE